MKPSESDAGELGNNMRISFVAPAPDLVTYGTWTRCVSRSMASGTTSGEWLIRTVMCWMFWCTAAATSRPQRHSSGFRKLLKSLRYVPRVFITNQWQSYGASKRELLSGVDHRQRHYVNNHAENSHQPTRQSERRLQGVKSPGHA